MDIRSGSKVSKTNNYYNSKGEDCKKLLERKNITEDYNISDNERVTKNPRR